jgi:serine/threonine-protein kinase HipA
MNPIENSNGLKLNITEEDNALDPALAMQTIDFYRLTEKKAEEIHDLIKKAVSGWRTVANKYHISKADQDLMAGSFK